MVYYLSPQTHQAHKVTDNLFFVTAFALGLRHGLDFDHVAAIADLVGSSTTIKTFQAAELTFPATKSQIKSCYLALAYALGHALVVCLLGATTLIFGAALPPWIDPIIERLVGVSLVALGSWMLYCLYKRESTQYPLTFQSRGAIILQLFNKLEHKIRNRAKPQQEHHHAATDLCNWQCASSLGALHGIGAETSSQVVLIASLAGLGNLTMSTVMLSGFILGMLTSSLTLAVIISKGYHHAMASSKTYNSLLGLIAILSIVTGFLFLDGKADLLPDLNKI